MLLQSHTILDPHRDGVYAAVVAGSLSVREGMCLWSAKSVARVARVQAPVLSVAPHLPIRTPRRVKHEGAVNRAIVAHGAVVVRARTGVDVDHLARAQAAVGC